MRTLEDPPPTVTDASSMPARLTASSDNVTTTSDEGTLDALDAVFPPGDGCDCAADEAVASGRRDTASTERRISRNVTPAPAARSAITATIRIGHRSVTRESLFIARLPAPAVRRYVHRRLRGGPWCTRVQNPDSGAARSAL